MMFERLEKRAHMLANSRAAARRRDLAERLAGASPRGIEIVEEGERVVLRGRGLARRMLLDPALRWLTMEGRDG